VKTWKRRHKRDTVRNWPAHPNHLTGGSCARVACQHYTNSKATYRQPIDRSITASQLSPAAGPPLLTPKTKAALVHK